MLRSGLALLMILLAAPAYAGSGSGGFHGGGFHGGGFHGARVFAFHRSRVRILGFIGGYGYGYDCGYGYGYNCGGYDYGYGYGNGYGSDYGGGGGNPVSSGAGSTGGYVPDPVGADIPRVVFPTNCWVRRAAYDPSGAYFGQVLVDLCRPSDSVTVTGLKARAKTPDPGIGTGQPAPLDRSGAPHPPNRAHDRSAVGSRRPLASADFGERILNRLSRIGGLAAGHRKSTKPRGVNDRALPSHTKP